MRTPLVDTVMGVPSRRVIGIGAVGSVAVVLAVAMIVLSAGPSQQVKRSYRSSHTFISTTYGICVKATAYGTATATRSGRAPLVRWADVHLSDPTITAAAYGLTAGRCDYTRRISLAATLQQNWSTDGSTPVTRRTDQGPTTGELRQFNSGSPVRLPAQSFPASLFDSDYPINGQILVDARLPTISEGFGYRTHLTLHTSTHP